MVLLAAVILLLLVLAGSLYAGLRHGWAWYGLSLVALVVAVLLLAGLVGT